MVNWQSSATLFLDRAIAAKLGHLVCGVYLWEWVTNLGFDYGLIADSKTFKWSIAVYLVCRSATLLEVALGFVILNLTIVKDQCNAIYKSFFAVGYLCAITSSILIAIRTIAIWNRNKYIFWVMTLALMAYTGTLLYVEIVGSGAVFHQANVECVSTDELQSRLIFTFAVVFDVGSIALALVGARLFWSRASGGLWVTLYRQGIVWMVAVLAIYIAPLVLLWLNLNIYMNTMLQLPAPLALAIVATRMFRGLYQAARTDTVQFFEPTRSASGGLRVDNHVMSVDHTDAVNRSSNGHYATEAFEMNPTKSSAAKSSSAVIGGMDHSNRKNVPRPRPTSNVSTGAEM